MQDSRNGDSTNLRYIKTRLSEKYQTIPSNNVDQYIMQNNDNPLSLTFVSNSKLAVTEMIQMNAEIVMTGLTAGKSYGIFFALAPQTTSDNADSAWPPQDVGKNYEYTVKVNGFTVVQKSYDTADMNLFAAGLATATPTLDAIFQNTYGINVVGTTATFTFNVTIPRDNRTAD